MVPRRVSIDDRRVTTTLHIEHPITDYEHWRAAFDRAEQAPNRRRSPGPSRHPADRRRPLHRRPTRLRRRSPRCHLPRHPPHPNLGRPGSSASARRHTTNRHPSTRRADVRGADPVRKRRRITRRDTSGIAGSTRVRNAAVDTADNSGLAESRSRWITGVRQGSRRSISPSRSRGPDVERYECFRRAEVEHPREGDGRVTARVLSPAKTLRKRHFGDAAWPSSGAGSRTASSGIGCCPSRSSGYARPSRRDLRVLPVAIEPLKV